MPFLYSDINIELLTTNPNENTIQNIFEELVLEIQSFLNLDPFDSEVKINLTNETQKTDNIFEFGVRKKQTEEFLIIEIFRNLLDFLPIILLREAYLLFVARDLRESEIVNIFINQRVQIDLSKLPYIKKWKEIYKKKVINPNFLLEEFDRLDIFLGIKPTKDKESPFQFFMSYIRKNVSLIKENIRKFYDTFFTEYTLKTSKSYFNEEIAETIMILFKIFHEVKEYKAMLEFHEHFNKFKENGMLETDLSARRFKENMQWIKNYSEIGPSYQLNWFALNISVIRIYLKFNPLLRNEDIDEFLKDLPFFIWLLKSRYSFTVEISGYFIIPNKYVKDLIRLLQKLKDLGFIIKFNSYLYDQTSYFRNLNYLKEKRNTLLNNKDLSYKQNLEISFVLNYNKKPYKKPLDFLDWILFDRIRYYSITGLSFERKTQWLRSIKEDILNHIISQQVLIENLKQNLDLLNASKKWKNDLLQIIRLNFKKGFFYVNKVLNYIVKIIDLIQRIIKEYPKISNINLFQTYLDKNGISKHIHDNIILNKKEINQFLYKEIFPRFFSNNDREFIFLKKYQIFSDLFKNFFDLKIFNLNSIIRIVKDEKYEILNQIFNHKKKYLDDYLIKYRDYQITHSLIEDKLKEYLQHDLIYPNLLNLIPSTYQENYHIILQNNFGIKSKLEKLLRRFPAYVLNTNRDFILAEFLLPKLKRLSKKEIISIIYNNFKPNIILIKSFWHGIASEAFSRKDFYDLEKKKFFYTHDLFEQYLLYAKTLFGDKLEPLSGPFNGAYQQNLQQIGKNINEFIELLESEKKNDIINFEPTHLKQINTLSQDLYSYIQKSDEFLGIKNLFFYENFIKSIKFFPQLQKFGLGQYFLYFHPTNLELINFKLLLANNFQNVKFSVYMNDSNSYLFKYIYPYLNPNMSWFNWLSKSKKIIREYCLFFVKQIYQILQFHSNLNKNGWDLDPNRFKMYFQKILFNHSYEIHIPAMNLFNIGDLGSPEILSPESKEFKMLTKIYDKQSIDIKSYLGTKKFKTISYVKELCEKGLIFPYLKLKNLDLLDKIYIILPDIPKKFNRIIIDIFSFFNYGFIYEIEGEYYIHGFSEERKFENGLMIKLYLPDCQLDEFERLFDLIFQYLKIDHYLILNDMVDGKELLKSIYGNLDFLKDYNPLINLIWNDKEKIWTNYKLFTEKFEPIYPDLFYGKDKYILK